MVELDAFKSELNTYEEPLKEVRDSLDLSSKEQRIEDIIEVKRNKKCN